MLKLGERRSLFLERKFPTKSELDEAELVAEKDEAAAAGLANAPGRGLVSGWPANEKGSWNRFR